MRRRGVTLMELLVVLVMMAIIAAGSVRSFTVGVDYHTRYLPERQREDAIRTFENRIRGLFENLYFDPDQTVTTFTLAETGNSGGLPNTDASSDQVTFTIVRTPPQQVLNATSDFETLNEEFGPVGGIEEISISTTPVGDAGNQTGLFLRVQSPGDSDFTQGGYESVLWDQVESIAFEGFDGTTWTSIWDTETGEARIPAAVRISYVLRQDPETVRTLIVRLPQSDVTPDNPYGQGEPQQ